MAICTERDMDIFRILANGPLSGEQIRRELEKYEEQKKKSDSDSEENTASRKMTMLAFQTRIRALIEGKYIVSKLYCSRLGRESLYALRDRSIDLLVSGGLQRKDIRTRFPTPAQYEIKILNVINGIQPEVRAREACLWEDDKQIVLHTKIIKDQGVTGERFAEFKKAVTIFMEKAEQLTIKDTEGN